MSGPEIARKLHIPLHRIYRVLDRQGVQRRDARAQYQLRAVRMPLSYHFLSTFSRRQHDLYIAGLMLYYGEGAKSGKTVDFVNSDPLTHRIFIRFLREVCGVTPTRLRCYLYCFTDQDPQRLIRYWGKTLGIPIRQFTKPYIRKVSGSHTRRAKSGVLHLRYNDKRLLMKILALIAETGTSLV